MKINQVRTYLLSDSWASTDPGWKGGDAKSTALVKVDTEEGVSGLGEIILGYFAPEVVPALVDYYAPLLIGENPMNTDPLWRKLHFSSKWWGRNGAALSVISGIDIALWDLKGKALGVPVYQLLGGLARDRILAYASVGGAPWPPERMLEKARRYISAGYRAIKIGQFYATQVFYDSQRGSSMKPPPTALYADQEAEKFGLLRRELGNEIDLMMHNHMGSGRTRPMSLDQAVRVARAVEPYGLLFIEEPLPYEDIHGYAELRRRTSVPVAGGEMLSGTHEFEAFLSANALGIIQPDVSFVGGITTTWKIMTLAESRHVPIALHLGGSFGPAFAAGLHLSLACPHALVLEQVPAAVRAQSTICKWPLDLIEGAFLAPSEPGLGVELNDEIVHRFPFVPGTGERG